MSLRSSDICGGRRNQTNRSTRSSWKSQRCVRIRWKSKSRELDRPHYLLWYMACVWILPRRCVCRPHVATWFLRVHGSIVFYSMHMWFVMCPYIILCILLNLNFWIWCSEGAHHRHVAVNVDQGTANFFIVGGGMQLEGTLYIPWDVDYMKWLHRVFTKPKVELNSHANTAEWDTTCIFHWHSFSLLYCKFYYHSSPRLCGIYPWNIQIMWYTPILIWKWIICGMKSEQKLLRVLWFLLGHRWL